MLHHHTIESLIAQYQHIVLGIYAGGMFGAIGLSRRDSLMDKELKVRIRYYAIRILNFGVLFPHTITFALQYTSLFELIKDYERAYTALSHRLLCCRLSKPVPHDTSSSASDAVSETTNGDGIFWRQLVVLHYRVTKEEIRRAYDKFAKDLKLDSFKGESVVLSRALPVAMILFLYKCVHEDFFRAGASSWRSTKAEADPEGCCEERCAITCKQCLHSESVM